MGVGVDGFSVVGAIVFCPWGAGISLGGVDITIDNLMMKYVTSKKLPSLMQAYKN